MRLLEVKHENFMTFPHFEASDKDFMQDADLILADENCDDNERRFIFSQLKNFPDPLEFMIGVPVCPESQIEAKRSS